jgi:hypothetical protein
MFRAGARKVLHREGFRQPGGGGAFVRLHGGIRQELRFWHSWRLDRAGEVSFYRRQWFRSCSLESSDPPRRFVVDPLHGDPKDLAVEVGDWFRTEVLPRFAAPLDPLAIARELEARGQGDDRRRAAALYQALALEADAARAWPPQLDDAPF